MKNVIGVGYKKANIYDFVQFFKCKGTKAKQCPGIFWPEGRCTNPPCNKCQGKSSRQVTKLTCKTILKREIYNTIHFQFFPLISCKNYQRKDKNVVRKTASGKVKGEVRRNKLNKEENYYAFHAIPYGKSPIKSDRFQRPHPAEPWTDIFDASDSNKYKCCYQVCVTQKNSFYMMEFADDLVLEAIS